VNLFSHDFVVHQAVASNLANICKVVGYEQTLQRMMKVYIRLSNDDIWGVRKACAETIVRMAESVPPEQRAEQLVPQLESFLSDVCQRF
jgi:serine/threonine-protein phosphatase 4 regulatory subunit 1